jgi:dTDP-4-dehydrorhamnose 3,5-epimerase-like enzyme
VNCHLIDIPTFHDDRGTLSVLELANLVPFPVRRLFYCYDVPETSVRGAHALKECHQLLIQMSGSSVVRVEHQNQTTDFALGTPRQGLYLPPKAWREIREFSKDSSFLVLASELYQPDGYYRDYEAWKTSVDRTNG